MRIIASDPVKGNLAAVKICPEPVRKVLHLKAGDAIAFDIEDHQILLRKARPLDLVFAEALKGTLNEWESTADEEAYREL